MDEPGPNTWKIGPILSPALRWGKLWGNLYCRCWICNIKLLMGEWAGFFCGTGGKYFNNTMTLPPLPLQCNTFINDLDISSKSWVLNLIFSFTSMETTHPFPAVLSPPSFIAIQGHIYHWSWPNYDNSAICWLLYDGFIQNMAPFENLAQTLPANWIAALWNALLAYNPLVGEIFHLSILDAELCPNPHLTLEDTGAATEIAAITYYERHWEYNIIWSKISQNAGDLLRWCKPNNSQPLVIFGSHLPIPCSCPM